MISTDFTLVPVAGAPRKLRFVAALGAAAAIVSCLADAAALFVEQPARTATAHEVLAAGAVPHPGGDGSDAAGSRRERPTVVADAAERRKAAVDQPLEPCAAPSPPQFEATPQGPRELGDFPGIPYA
jgi:hypothetical protein